MMIFYTKLYIATLTVFFCVDMFWLGVLARGFYRKHLGYLMTPATNWTAAVIFYLLFVFGILYFVVLPGMESGSLKVTLLRAALYGLITYATYDLTNLATLKDWPVWLTIVDITWGVVLSVLVSLAGYFIGGWLK